MKKQKRGAPRKSADRAKGELLQVRVNAAEKAAFAESAELAGLPLSGWVRTRLRETAKRELEGLGHNVPFLTGKSDGP